MMGRKKLKKNEWKWKKKKLNNVTKSKEMKIYYFKLEDQNHKIYILGRQKLYLILKKNHNDTWIMYSIGFVSVDPPST